MHPLLANLSSYAHVNNFLFAIMPDTWHSRYINAPYEFISDLSLDDRLTFALLICRSEDILYHV